MFATCRTLFVIALGLGFLGAPAARAQDKKPEKPAAEPAKPIIIQIDASKLPPDVLKQLLQLSENSKPTGKPDPAKPGEKPTGKPNPEPSKPGAKPNPEPSKPGTKPEPTKPGVKPGEKPNPEPAKPVAKPSTEPGKPGVKPGAEQGKPAVIELHVDHLPPEVLQQLLQLAGKSKGATEPGKPGAKPTPEPGKPVKPGMK